MSDTFAQTTSETSGGTASAVKEEAGFVASDAKEATKNVATTAKVEAQRVTSDAKDQAKNLLHQTTSELSSQAGVQQQRAAEGLKSVSGELRSMADNSQQGGVATSVVKQVAGQVDNVADWLGDRDPAALLNEVKSFARQKPLAFIAIALGAGVLAGRVIKSLTDSSDETAPSTKVSSTGDAWAGQSAYESASPTDAAFAGSAATGVVGTSTVGAPGSTTSATADEPIFEETAQHRGVEL